MKRVQDALASTQIPAFATAWRKTAANPKAPDTYIVYTTMTVERDFRDDEPEGYRVFVYMNLWTRGDPTADIQTIRQAMSDAGFHMSEERDSYNDDTDQLLISWTWVCREAKDGTSI